MTGTQDADSNGRKEAPDDPTDLGAGSWLAAAKRTLKEYKDDDLQDRAAALTYFGIQSVFPGLLVLVSLLGFVGRSAMTSLPITREAPLYIAPGECGYFKPSRAAASFTGPSSAYGAMVSCVFKEPS